MIDSLKRNFDDDTCCEVSHSLTSCGYKRKGIKKLLFCNTNMMLFEEEEKKYKISISFFKIIVY